MKRFMKRMASRTVRAGHRTEQHGINRNDSDIKAATGRSILRGMMESLESRRLLASITWANAAGQTNWNSGASWVGGVAPGAADTAVFPSATTIVQPSLTANASVAGISINNSGADYNIGGSGFTLTLGSAGIALSSPTSTTASTSTVSPAIAIGANTTLTSTNNTGINTLTSSGAINTGSFRIATSGTGDVTLTGVVSGSGGIDANGTGTIRLGGANTFSGGVAVNAGTVQAQTSGSSLGSGTVLLGATSGTAAATLATTVGVANAITVRAGSSGAVTIDGRISSGTATLSGAVTLNRALTVQKNASSGTGTTILSGSISGTGNITLKNEATGGTLELNGASINMAGAISNLGSGAGATRIGGVLGASVTGLTQDSTTSGLEVRSNNPSFTGGVTINAGTLGVMPLAAGVNMQLGTGTILLGATSGSATATLSLNNNAQGGDVGNPLTVRSGGTGERVIRYSSTSGGGSYRGAITLNNDLTLRKQSAGGGNLQVSGGITGTGNLTLDNQGTGTFSITTNPVNHTGTITNIGTGTASAQINGGIGVNVTTITQSSATSGLSIATSGMSLGANRTIANNGAANISISSGVSAGSAGTKTLTHTGTGSGTLTVSGAISNGSGVIAVVQNSATSPLILNGTNTHTGGTTVTAGTLGGTGSLGPVSVSSGGRLSPGAVGATGVVNTGNLSFASGASYDVTINTNTAGTGYDQTNVVGTVSLGSATLTLAGTRTSTIGQTIQIITNDGTDAVTGTFAGLAQGAFVALNGVVYTISYTGGTGNDIVLTDAGTSSLANLSPWGVSSSANSSGTYTTWMPQMASAGVKWVRNFPEWGGIEPTNDGWNLTGITNLMNAADANGMYVSGMFMYAASWLGIGHHVLPTSAAHLDEYKEYVAKVVDHTAGRIDHYEVWNEPNSGAFASNGTPANYAAVVNATWEAAKPENPNVQLGLTVADYDVAYLRNVIQAGVGTNFDFIAVHPYSILGTVEAGQEALYMSIVPTLRKMLQEVAPSKANVPIWFTEIGSESAVVGTDRQAREVVKAFSMGIAQGVQRINWYEAKDGQSSFGLVNSGGTPKTSHAALDRLEAALGQTPIYKGWVQLNSQDYGFVFQGPSGNVLVTWAPSGTSNSYNFGASVNVLDSITGVATNGVTSYTIGTNPVIVTNIPASLVTTAQGNINLPLTWGGDYSGASSISVTTGATHTESGLHFLNRDGRSMTVPAYGTTVRYAGAGTPSATSESFTSSGATIASAQSGYTGTGYLQFSNTTGSYVEWTGTNDNASSTLTRRVRIRYANGDAASRTMTLTATRSGGGVEVTQTVTFPTTGGWNQWRFMDINVVLPAKGSNGSGAFTIRATTNGTSTGPFLDFLNNGNTQQLFTIDPAFLSYTHTGVTITVETKRIESGQNAGYNLKYESVNGVQTNYGEWKTIGTSSDPNVWSTQTFYIDTFNGGTFINKPDTQFVGNWGYHFLLDSDGIENSSYYIRNVTVTKGAALSAAIDYVDDSAPKAATLRMKQVTPALALAKSLWAQGSRERREAMDDIEVRIEDLPGRLLGTSYDNIVVLDADAAGLGWSTSLGKVQKGKIDLLTVLNHELGHVLGYGHDDAEAHPVMADGLATGVRLLPDRPNPWSSRPVQGAVGHHDDDDTAPASRWSELGL